MILAVGAGLLLTSRLAAGSRLPLRSGNLLTYERSATFFKSDGQKILTTVDAISFEVEEALKDRFRLKYHVVRKSTVADANFVAPIGPKPLTVALAWLPNGHFAFIEDIPDENEGRFLRLWQGFAAQPEEDHSEPRNEWNTDFSKNGMHDASVIFALLKRTRRTLEGVFSYRAASGTETKLTGSFKAFMPIRLLRSMEFTDSRTTMPGGTDIVSASVSVILKSNNIGLKP